MKDRIIGIIQVVVSLLLTMSILLQHKGAGLSGVFGGEGNVYRTKRGAEKFLFYFTIFLALVLGGLSLSRILL